MGTYDRIKKHCEKHKKNGCEGCIFRTEYFSLDGCGILAIPKDWPSSEEVEKALNDIHKTKGDERSG